MKSIAFILSIYIFVLNLAPCEDYVMSDDNAKTEISQSMDDDHQHQGSDLCSPFCICQCCHINATYFQYVDLNLDFPYISTLDFLYLNGTEKDFTPSIFQPPRA